jgi:hypothetical protein
MGKSYSVVINGVTHMKTREEKSSIDKGEPFEHEGKMYAKTVDGVILPVNPARSGILQAKLDKEDHEKRITTLEG